MIEEFRVRILQALEEGARKAADGVVNLAYYTSTVGPNGQVLPGTTVEAIGAQAIALNARLRAIADARTSIEQIYKSMTAPAQSAPDASQKKEGPY